MLLHFSLSFLCLCLSFAAAAATAAVAAAAAALHPSIVSFLRVFALPMPIPNPTLTSPMVASTRAATNSITARIFFFFF